MSAEKRHAETKKGGAERQIGKMEKGEIKGTKKKPGLGPGKHCKLGIKFEPRCFERGKLKTDDT